MRLYSLSRMTETLQFFIFYYYFNYPHFFHFVTIGPMVGMHFGITIQDSDYDRVQNAIKRFLLLRCTTRSDFKGVKANPQSTMISFLPPFFSCKGHIICVCCKLWLEQRYFWIRPIRGKKCLYSECCYTWNRTTGAQEIVH